jgi:DNA-binding response OmpR family regulator
VSPSPSSLTSKSRSRGILLIEEYGALAVAISSALRKFAPLHHVRVAHDFAEAERVAESLCPELFVLDIDPPPVGELQFFQKLNRSHPDSRALVIAAGTSAELRAERGTAGAIQFIEKPFDLAEFGAAVQALVGPWNGALRGARGTLRDLHLIDLIQVKCLTLRSSSLRIEAAGRRGMIHFRKGQISHAATETRTGAEALEQIASWSEGQLTEEELPEGAPQTIETNWPELLLPVVRRLAAAQKEGAATEVAPSPAGVEPGSKILVIDDTEMLLVFVADVLATHDPRLRILTAQTGAEGLHLAHTEQPDLILLDYSLTDTTGDKVCGALLAEETTARIPVLMMSGHPTELARTAEDYANVIAALPKPFLSGALIDAVEQALATGPLPAATPAVASKSPSEPKVPVPSSNGDTPAGDGAEKKNSVAQASLEASATPPAESGASSPITIESVPPPAAGTHLGGVVRESALNLTFSFALVALELSPRLQIVSARLELITPFVAAEMTADPGPKTDFRVGRVEFELHRGISALRLLPTHEEILPPAPASSLAIANLNLEVSKHHLMLEPGQGESMRVELTAPFQITGIELSPRFEVAAFLLRANGREVHLRNRADDPGAAFEIEAIEQNPAGELRSVLVRSTVAAEPPSGG